MSSQRILKNEGEKIEVKVVRNPKEEQKFLTEFIELYKASTCLWKYSCKQYRNRRVKEIAYKNLVAKMRTFDPKADKNSVIRKINALRTAFRREFKKIRKFEKMDQQSNGGENFTARKYTTSLWYYDIMKFVVEEQDHSLPPPGQNFGDWSDRDEDADQTYSSVNNKSASSDDVETLMEFVDDDDSRTEHEQPQIKVEPISPESSRAASPAIAPEVPLIGTVYSQKSITREAPPPEHQQTIPQQSLIKLIKQRVAQLQSRDTDQPDYELFGAYVASKLRRAPRNQSIIAEKVIAEVLMRASLGTLEETTIMADIKVPANSNSFSR